MIYLPNDKDKPSKKSKVNLENSPDSEKFEKCLDDLTKYVRDGINNETEFQKLFMFFSDIMLKLSVALNSTPFMPSSTISGIPAWSVVIMNIPLPIASRILIG